MKVTPDGAVLDTRLCAFARSVGLRRYDALVTVSVRTATPVAEPRFCWQLRVVLSLNSPSSVSLYRVVVAHSTLWADSTTSSSTEYDIACTVDAQRMVSRIRTMPCMQPNYNWPPAIVVEVSCQSCGAPPARAHHDTPGQKVTGT